MPIVIFGVYLLFKQLTTFGNTSQCISLELLHSLKGYYEQHTNTVFDPLLPLKLP